MPKVPSMSSKDLVKLLEKAGAFAVRQGKTDHAIALSKTDTPMLSKIDIPA
jgi:predicted RNA binding protein YcfA (HicA-like mRNA interferase family)